MHIQKNMKFVFYIKKGELNCFFGNIIYTWVVLQKLFEGGQLEFKHLHVTAWYV